MDKKEQELRQEYADLQQKLQDPSIYSSKEYPKLAKRIAEIAKIIALFDKIAELNLHLTEAQTLATNKDPDIATMATDEINQLTNELSSTVLCLQLCLPRQIPTTIAM